MESSVTNDTAWTKKTPSETWNSGACAVSDDPGIGHLLSNYTCETFPDATKTDCRPTEYSGEDDPLNVPAWTALESVNVTNACARAEGAEIKC